MKNSLLSLNNIHLSLPEKIDPILHGISLDIYEGDFIILLGSNGSGKSSLIKVINGLAIPTKGMLLFQEKNLNCDPLNVRARFIVTLTQDLNLSTFSQLTVFENCLIALHRNEQFSLSLSKRKRREQVVSYLSQYHAKLCDYLDTPTSFLSGGERQILAFAMSLWKYPLLLLLDEHTSALDPIMAKKLMKLTDQIATTHRITTCMTTHNLEDALLYGNRLIVMNQGKIIYDVSGLEKRQLTHKQLLSLYDP